jgi:hypothetical protein
MVAQSTTLYCQNQGSFPSDHLPATNDLILELLAEDGTIWTLSGGGKTWQMLS